MDQDRFDLTHVLDEHGYCMGCDRKNPDPKEPCEFVSLTVAKAKNIDRYFEERRKVQEYAKLPNKLWLLMIKIEYTDDIDWDDYRSFVIKAPTEQDARFMAGETASYYRNVRQQWTDERFSTCEEIALEGEPRIILKDNKGA